MPGIDVTAPCPRVNFELMSQYTGKRVRFVGKVEQISENTMKVRSSDDSIVEVILSGAAPDGPYVEIDGTVEGPNTIREDSSTSFGSSFDMQNYNEVCKLMNGPYQRLFL